MKKKLLFVGLPALIVVIYVAVLTPMFPEAQQWFRYETIENTVVDETTGVEYRRVYQIHRWGHHKGRKHGRFTTYRLDGGINTRGFYVNDEPDGYWTSYDREGVIRTWTQFVDGKPVRTEKVPFAFARRLVVPTTFEGRSLEPTVEEAEEAATLPSE